MATSYTLAPVAKLRAENQAQNHSEMSFKMWPKLKSTISKHDIVMNIFKFILAAAVITFLVLLFIFTVFLVKETVTNYEDVSSEANYEAIHLSWTNIPKVPSTCAATEAKYRRHFIRNMTCEAWNAYHQYAWGSLLLRPVSKTAQNWSSTNEAPTITAAMSTLHVMGLHEQFEQGKEWIANELNFTKMLSEVEVEVEDNLSPLVHQTMGGLLSCYALTGDELFLRKVAHFERILLPTFNLTTSLLYFKSYQFIADRTDRISYLVDIGYQQPELIFLADVTQNRQLKSRLSQIRRLMDNIDKPNGHQIDVDTWKWTDFTWFFGVSSPAFYKNRVKSYRQSGGRDLKLINEWALAMKALVDHGIFHTGQVKHGEKAYLTFLNLHSRPYVYLMPNSACSLGAMISLGAASLIEANVTHYGKQAAMLFELADNLTETCHALANQTKTKMLPFMYEYAGLKAKILFSFMNLRERSENLAESYFILWRLTHEQKYRDYAWEMVQAIYRHCRTESGGYSGIRNVDEIPVKRLDSQNAYFLSATLKYLYLTFTDDTVLSLDEWIFNDLGHPLPICGKHDLYPKEMCRN